MKPFNLKDALAGKKVVRDGKEIVRIAHFPEVNSRWRKLVVVVPESKSPTLASYYYSEDGVSIESTVYLQMAGEKKEGWVNVYSNSGLSTWRGNAYSTKESADQHASRIRPRTACIHIEWEE